MKNFEKYKTPEEAFTAQVQFCQKQSNDENNCHKNGCKYSTGTTPCLLQWLYDEDGKVGKTCLSCKHLLAVNGIVTYAKCLLLGLEFKAKKGNNKLDFYCCRYEEEECK